MFREMRRKKQMLPESESIEILKRHNTCVLSMLGDDGYPYSLPITYCYSDSKIYMHGAKEGHKIDAITNCDKVSLCVIDSDQIYQQKYTNKYKSVIVFGRARLLEDKREIYSACSKLAHITCPNAIDGIEDELNKDIDRTAIIEITPEHISGKEGLEFYKDRIGLNRE